jgi:acetyl esterase/lipase
LFHLKQTLLIVRLGSIGLYLLAACGSANAETMVWQPSVGHTQIPIWPGVPPDTQPVPGPETVTVSKELLAGKPATAVTNVTRPTMTVYAPQGKSTAPAVVVIPGGGFQMLAIDLEGTELCDWLTSKGIACVLLKYRVPSEPYVWQCDCRPHNLSTSVPSLQDVQRAMRLVRFHAAEWRIDPHKVGVLGFSAGGYLVAEISTKFERRLYPPVDAADTPPTFLLAANESPNYRVASAGRGMVTDDRHRPGLRRFQSELDVSGDYARFSGNACG